jgi:hypothetical protein
MDFNRPREALKFLMGGLKLNSAPNTIPPNKYALLQNIRGYGDDSVRTRPGYSRLFNAGLNPIMDMRAYMPLTVSSPRILAVDSMGNVYLDNGAVVGVVGQMLYGASMIPFRPNESPLPWMYIATAGDYQKFSAPTSTNVVTQQKAGIEEPQLPPDAVVSAALTSYVEEPVSDPGYTPTGVAGTVTTIARVSDTVQAVYPDPTGLGVSSTVRTGGGFSSGAVTRIIVTNYGVGYSSAPTVTITGGGGSGATAVATFEVIPPYPPYYPGGVILYVGVTSAGSGYTSPPTITFSGGGGTGASAVAEISSFTTPTVEYQRFEALLIGGNPFIVQDVFPPLPTPVAIQGIYYYTGTTGKCVVVPAGLADGSGVGEESLYSSVLIPSLRRGALVNIGAETCVVQTVTTGPNGTVCFETTTQSAHTAAEFLTGVAAIQVLGSPMVGQTILSPATQFLMTVPATYAGGTAYTTGEVIQFDGLFYEALQNVPAGNPPLTSELIPNANYWIASPLAGLGAVTFPIVTNPFVSANFTFQSEDYIHFSVNISTLTNLVEFKLLIDVGDGSFTENFYYFTVRPNDIAQAVANLATQLGTAQTVTQKNLVDEENAIESGNQGDTFSSGQSTAGDNQWSEILIPISSFTRVGNDNTRSLQNANSMQLLINSIGAMTVQFNSTYVMGGFQADVGDIGAPLRYRVRPRSSVTGVVGNPSPATRYGANPRRQQVTVLLPSASYDPQIDTWDIFRYGGAVTSWRFIGSTPSSNTQFLDTYDDAAAQAGNELEFDNFEPWPSVDVPNNGAIVQVCGIVAVLTSTNANMSSYLPGTLIQLAGANVYTLRTRPTIVSGNNYLLQFEENAGALTSGTFIIQEPIIANRRAPYMWGSDANGVVFAVGDSLRPGNVYYSKNFAPDHCPDKNNVEVTPPSEPLMGGLIVDGLGFVASTERWWAMYPQPDNPISRYNLVQQPFPRGLIANYGVATDNKSIFWWAKDGIWSSTEGSLTDEDLNTLFPREGVPGKNYTYGSTTIMAPDYAVCQNFRLTYSNGYLYATYVDSDGQYHQLIRDIKKKAWMLDSYADQISSIYHVEQQAGYQFGGFAVLNPVMLMGAIGKVVEQADATNDDTVAIPVIVNTFEFDAGDLRAPKQWGDLFTDVTPITQITMNAYSQGSVIGGPYAIVPTATRQRGPTDLGGIVISDFFGIGFAWTDNFSTQTVPTRLYAWQPTFVIQPARGIGWYTFGTTFTLNGYIHIREILAAWVSTQPVTLTIATYDGQSPSNIVIPSSGGAYRKAYFPLTPNKGLLYSFTAKSTSPFQFFLDDWEIHCGSWGRSGPYTVAKKLGENEVLQGVV